MRQDVTNRFHCLLISVETITMTVPLQTSTVWADVGRGHGVQCCWPSVAPLSARREAAVRGDAAALTAPRCVPGSTWRDMRVPGDRAGVGGRVWWGDRQKWDVRRMEHDNKNRYVEGVDGGWGGRKSGCTRGGRTGSWRRNLEKKKS